MTSLSVLVIGGTGLISTGITKALLARGAKVTHFNRGKTENRAGSPVSVMVGDRNDFAAFEKAFANTHFDAVIDMICFKPAQAESDVCAFAGRTGHFIFCSTVCTYGNTQTVIPTPEGCLQKPHSEYGIDKVACEQVFLKAHEAGKFPVTIMRPSHTYGPGGTVINNLGWAPTFIDRLRKGKPIIISGDGHGLWQSAYCDDVGVGFAHAVGRKRCFGEAYNIVGDEEDIVTWDQYTQRTARAIGAPEPRIVHVPTDVLAAVAPKRYQALTEIFRFHGIYSNAKIHRDIPEYRHATPYEEGVRRTVAWMDAHHKIENSDTDTVDDTIAAQMESLVGTLKHKVPAA